LNNLKTNKIMKKEFIPYEQALALKELGFDEPCFGFYDESLYFPNNENQYGTFCNQILDASSCSAPLYQQAFRWFREKYGWTIKINKIVKDTWSFTLENFTLKRELFEGRFNTYEEAELECLKKLIEIVKSK